MAKNSVNVEMVVKNEKTAKCLFTAFQKVSEAYEDYPWSEDLKEAKAKLEFVLKNLCFLSERA